MEVEEFPQPRDVYEAISKTYGESAERLTREEYDAAVTEIKGKCAGHFPKMESILVLDDKPTFGDVDLVVITDAKQDEDDEKRMSEIFGGSLLEYRHQKNNKYDSLLVRLDNGKVVQVDLARTADQQEFEAKLIHASKGQSSAVIGTLARAYGFKFSQDGFYEIFRDSKGQITDVLITDDLFQAMRMLGLDPEKWIAAKNIDDIVAFVKESELYRPGFFTSTKFRHKERVSTKRRSVQDYMFSQLSAGEDTRVKPDYQEYLREHFPEEFKNMHEREKDAESKNVGHEHITGEDVMRTFNLKPSKRVAELLAFIKDNFPKDTKITPEIVEVIERKFS